MYFYPVRLTLEPFELRFHIPFTITHGVRTHTSAVFAKLEAEGVTGYGEAALPPYLSETAESVIAFIRSHEYQIQTWMNATHLLKAWMAIEHPAPAAKACIEMAILDWKARKENVSIRTLLGINPSTNPLCSLTIGAGSDADLQTIIQSNPETRLFKLKLTGVGDLKRVIRARALTKVPLAVDANGAWKDVEETAELLSSLKKLGVIFVEQPFPKDDLLHYANLKDRSVLPVIADESITSFNVLRDRWHLFHGVNIKLMKCPGLFEALEMIRFCREKQLTVMIGCMSESGCGVGAATALAPLTDYADLDGPLLISNDPFEGMSYTNGEVSVIGKFGTGVSKRSG